MVDIPLIDISVNTHKAYSHDLQHFTDCGFTLPCDSNTILKYIQHCALLNLANETIKRRVRAIKYYHRVLRHQNPCDSDDVRSQLRHVVRFNTRIPRKALPLTLEQLFTITEYLTAQSTDSHAVRNLALILIGFFGALRRGELASLKWSEVTFTSNGVVLTLSQSKTDQYRKGQIITIPSSDSIICPVRALRSWREHSEATEYIFTSIESGSNKFHSWALSGDQISFIIKDLAKKLKFLDAGHYSGHSLRRGFATLAAQKGMKINQIMSHGRWKSVSTVLGYIHDNDTEVQSAVAGLMTY